MYEVCYPPVAEDGFYRPIGSVETSLSTVRIRHRPAHLFGETETCQEHYALTAYDGGEIIIHIRGLNYWRPSQREEPDIIGPWAWTIRPPGGVPLPPTVQVEQTPFDATTMPPTPTPAPEPDTGPVPTN